MVIRPHEHPALTAWWALEDIAALFALRGDGPDPVARCLGCSTARELCPDGFCEPCHVSIDFRECCDGTDAYRQMVLALVKERT